MDIYLGYRTWTVKQPRKFKNRCQNPSHGPKYDLTKNQNKLNSKLQNSIFVLVISQNFVRFKFFGEEGTKRSQLANNEEKFQIYQT